MIYTSVNRYVSDASRFIAVCFASACSKAGRLKRRTWQGLSDFGRGVARGLNRLVLTPLANVRHAIRRRMSNRQVRQGRLKLRVLQGIHSGARRNCNDGDTILVGSNQDCDVALFDPGIAQHHCMLTLLRGKVNARAIDASVQVERCKDRSIDTSSTHAWWRIVLTDDVVLGLGPADYSEWANAPRLPKAKLSGARRAYLAVAGAVVVAASLGIAAYALQVDVLPADVKPLVPAASVDVQELIANLQLQEIKVDENGEADIQIRGVAPTKSSFERLRHALERENIDAAIDVRVGENIARDVREVLRLSGIVAKSRYQGDGEVEISGAFLDEELLESVVSSRAMVEIDRLNLVTAVDPGKAERDRQSIPEGKNIVAVVRGSDPYVVTADGSRYYIGAILPSGETLQEINDDEVLITSGTHTRRLDVKSLKASPSNS